MAVELNTREVTVQQVNDHGIKADGSWLNISKFAPERDVLLPSVGERVVVHLDKAGFVRKVEPVTPPAPTAPSRVTPEADRSNVGAISPTIVQDDRGVVITRLAVLNTATAILSSGGGATTLEEVLEVAARLEVWACR